MDDSMTCDEVFLEFADPTGQFMLIVEDDGRVAYSYLLKRERIVADVWLYNVGPAPEVPEWKMGGRPPFLNPADCCEHPLGGPGLSADNVVSVDWHGSSAELFVDGIHWASLEPGSRPGRCRHATRPSPVALPLEAPR